MNILSSFPLLINAAFVEIIPSASVFFRIKSTGCEHFRPNTPEGAYRQKMLDGLYHYYGKHEGASDFDPEKWAGAENLYWKNLLRTMNTQELEEFYKKRLGELPKMEG